MISQLIPHTALYIPVTLKASAIFNTPILGMYKFNLTGLMLMDYDLNSRYFFDTMTVGANVASTNFSAAIIDTPKISLKKSISGENIYVREIPIPLLSENRDVTVFTSSDRDGEDIIADVTGTLQQTSDLIGVGQIDLYICFNVFKMDEKSYNIAFRNTLTSQYSRKVNN
jgi:hypothetical protein